jgi:NADH dehydrogenase FAD-containing subunit
MAASAKETRVVIVGGGFAGAQLAHRLEMSKAPLHITLVDRKEYFEVCRNIAIVFLK